MTRGMNNGRKLKIRRYADLLEENKALKAQLAGAREALREIAECRSYDPYDLRETAINALAGQGGCEG